jgi:uncharacterized protein (DUF488 family)
MSPNTLFTFGYEGMTIDGFVDRLRASEVELVVDVRELPLSRKPGFSKRAFSGLLAAAGISYQHRPLLGCPKAIREQYRRDSDWDAYSQQFLAYLASGAQSELKSLAATSREYRSCLVCFEADPLTCHRTYVARAATQFGAPTVQHLIARTVLADAQASLAA